MEKIKQKINVLKNELALKPQIELNEVVKFPLKNSMDISWAKKIEEKRISLTEVENRLLEHEFIQNCCAIILEENRQIIAAIIELNDSGKKFLEENDKLTLNRFLKNHLSQYFEPVTLPRKWRYIEQIPVNSQGKILRANLDKLL